MAIIGAGCAGLSLACALVGRERRVVALEPRRQYAKDRTFCHWDVHPHPFGAAISHRWRRWLVRFQGREVVASGRYQYCHIPGDAFYRLALERLAGAANVELRLGWRVEAIAGPMADGRMEVVADRGRILAHQVVDSRPPAWGPPASPPTQGVHWVQHFVGYRLEANGPVFDPTTVTLMDFDVPQTHGIHFFYVLPFSATEALVEATFFSPQPLDLDHYHRAIVDYCAQRFGLVLADCRLLERERGAIPMTTEPLARPRGAAIPVGTNGGAVKPSSGYGFAAIQRHVPHLVAALEAHRPPPPPRERLPLALDRIFLAFIQRYPARAPGLLFQLFERVEADRLVRFLSDAATVGDYAAVMAAMPAGALTKEALRSHRLWLAPA
ncbi:MAG: lycopene cyclase family protein [Candidatus Competibacterales bacterium]